MTLHRYLLTSLLLLLPLTGNAGEWWLHNVQIVDGSGTAAFPGAVHVVDGRIVAVHGAAAMPAELVSSAALIDGKGLTLAPGFIDTHSHVDDEINEHPGALAAVSQGITTAVIGQDGGSPFPLGTWFAEREARGAAINLAAYSGHNTLREQIMTDDPNGPASAAAREAMASALLADLKAGALGLSSGLEYEPGIHSEPAEIIALAQLAADHGGRYISHIRSEDRWFFEALDEAINIGRQTGVPVQISHIKLAMKSLWGRADEVLARLDAARAEGINVSADIYPYTYWQSNMMVLIPSRDLQAREEYAYALAEIAPPDGFWLTQFDPDPSYVGMTLTEIASARNLDPVTTYMQLTAESVAMAAETGQGADTMIGTSMTEEDISALLRWPHTNLCSDGSLMDLHPRGAGSFTRVLGRMVREQQRLTLPEAVHKMTGLAAENMGFDDRGRIAPGLAADLVLFDPATVLDHATPDQPGALSTGIHTVWVNGVSVFGDGAVTGKLPGQIIRRAP